MIKITLRYPMLPLKERQLKFCEEYVLNGFNGTKAYKIAYQQSNDNVCRVEAHKMLQDLRIKQRLDQLEGDYKIVGHRLNINKKVIMERIKDQLFAKKKVFFNGKEVGDTDDNTAVNSAINTYLKLVGDFSPEKSNLEVSETPVDINKLSDKEREELREKLLKTL